MANGMYTNGGIPTGGFDQNKGLATSNEGELGYVPGKADATRPTTVNQGSNGGGKTYNQSASEDFLGSSDYNCFDMSVGKWTNLKMDVDQPDTISHSDRTDDPDLPKK